MREEGVENQEAVSPVNPALALTRAFLYGYPRDGGRKLEALPTEAAASVLEHQEPIVRSRVVTHIAPCVLAKILLVLPREIAGEILLTLDSGPCALVLSQLDPDDRDKCLQLLDDASAKELRELMDYPVTTAGYMMDTRVLTLNKDMLVGDALEQLARFPAIARRRIYLLDNDLRLCAEVGLERLVVADKDRPIDELGHEVNMCIAALDPREDVAEILQKNSLESLPVIDIHRRLVGVIRGASAVTALKEDFAGDLQAMVGVSRTEQALSSSFFAVKKRQPWLQINLLSGFLAAAVVGLFESTIAQVTALAVLMPVAAGQSGNTGAQALAVTMRGLTLREITTRYWLRVMFKEAGAGLINGIAIAMTCAAGVYLWSRSIALAVVIALAMIISMTIAGVAGALVPICLKKLGQDPAQSSSIILTTVTDIAGFMSFLGIATLFVNFLPAG